MLTQKVAITGSNGFIGSSLRQAFIQKGIEVVGLCRNPQLENDIEFDLTDIATFNNIPDDIDTVIHTAYTTTAKDLKQAFQSNITGSKALFDYCRARSIRIIFLSSCSSHANARSFYGKSKYQLEGFLNSNDTIIRPGFVIGDGGIYKRLEQSLCKLKFAPLFWGGKQPLQIIHLKDLVTGIVNACLQKKAGIYNLVHPTVYPLQEFYRDIFIQNKMTPRFMHLPGNLTLAALKVTEFLKIPLPLTSENLLGLKYLQVFESDCKKLEVISRGFL
ncbi:MAG: NAD(P)-dependent oxidoreductase [Proteobacteria bacterium]|nr:NAD(P)-dependent oxidoreductase [Pseudomonadota bacterium]